MLDLLLKKAPHLTTHLSYTVRDATDADFYIPHALKDYCKTIDIKMTKNLCEKLSCNKSGISSLCRPTDTASYYHLGDSSYDVSCQPACFNTIRTRKYDASEENPVHTPQLNWHADVCKIVPDSTATYLEKPYWRDEKRYLLRVNDMPTGFSREYNPEPISCGFTYKNNRAYCGYYDRHLDAKGECSYSGWETGLDAVIGMSLINTIKESIRVSILQEHGFKIPDYVPELPVLDKKYTLEHWASDIDKTFVLPKPMIIIEPEESMQSAGKTKRDTTTVLKTIQEFNADTDELMKKVKGIIEALLKEIQTPEFQKTLQISIAFDFTMFVVRTLSKRLMSVLNSFLSKQMATAVIGKTVSKMVLTNCIKGIARKTIIDTSVRLIGKGVLALTKLLIAATSIIGWVTAIAAGLDFIFAIWDPYKYNTMFPAELPAELFESSERIMYEAFGTYHVNYTFEMYAQTLLSEEELLTLALNTYVDRATYLNSLTVNSEGSYIDKNDYFTVVGDKSTAQNTINEGVRRAHAQSIHFTPSEYDQFNTSFVKRVQLNRFVTSTAFICTLIGTACLSFAWKIISVLFLIITVLLLVCSRLFIDMGDTPIKLVDALGSPSVLS